MSSGVGKIGWLIVAVLLLPLGIGTCSTCLFCGAVGTRATRAPAPAAAASPSVPPGAPACAEGSACEAATRLLERAGAADSEALRALLADPGWLERLPPAATQTPKEKGQYYLRSLLGTPPATLEELRAGEVGWRVVESRTALDGASAVVRLEYTRAPGQAEAGAAILTLRREGGAWKIVPPR